MPNTHWLYKNLFSFIIANNTVIVANKNYTANHNDQTFEDICFDTSYPFWDRLQQMRVQSCHCYIKPIDTNREDPCPAGTNHANMYQSV